MKEFFKKIKNWANRNKGLAIIIALTIVLLLILLIIFLQMLIGGSSDKYGNRLDGIDKVKISNETFEGVKKEVTDTELTEDVSTRVQGKIVYTTITLKSDTSKDKAKEIASATLDNYSEDELKFYLKWKGEEGDTVVTGNKHHSLDSITWTNN